jgi:hypothetical protein
MMDEFDTLAEELIWPTAEMKRLVAQMDSLDANVDDVILES